MVGVFVTFQYDSDFDAAKIRKIADTAAPRFRGLAGLRTKAFTVDTEARQAINFYVWDSAEAARAFFNAEMRERVTGLYGVPPNIEFVEIATLIENGARP